MTRAAARIFSAAAAVAVLLGIPAAGFAIDGVDCAISAQAIQIASQVRGLKVKQSVPCKIQSKAQVEKYLRAVIKKKISSERIEFEGQAYRMLGIIPPDYDYLNGLISLYTTQLGGYYEPEDEYYAMASWMPAAMQMPIAVHELTHALQDQQFELDKLMDHKSLTSDELMARAALVEGDATAVMIDYSRSLAGRPPLRSETSVSAMMLQNLTGAMISASINRAPAALQAMMIFPYVSGLNFVHYLLREGGYPAVDAAFDRLPVSTEEILHPDKYLRSLGSRPSKFAELAQPKLASAKSHFSRPLFSDRLGEFAIATLLGNWIPPKRASEASKGWDGDRLFLYERRDSKSPSDKYLLAWVVKWETPEDAREFHAALSSAFARRLDTSAPQSADETTLDDPTFGRIYMTVSGNLTQLEIGARQGNEEAR